MGTVLQKAPIPLCHMDIRTPPPAITPLSNQMQGKSRFLLVPDQEQQPGSAKWGFACGPWPGNSAEDKLCCVLWGDQENLQNAPGY
jgi:hypothetical protein